MEAICLEHLEWTGVRSESRIQINSGCFALQLTVSAYTICLRRGVRTPGAPRTSVSGRDSQDGAGGALKNAASGAWSASGAECVGSSKMASGAGLRGGLYAEPGDSAPVSGSGGS